MTVNEPLAVGLPEIEPVDAFSENPGNVRPGGSPVAP